MQTPIQLIQSHLIAACLFASAFPAMSQTIDKNYKLLPDDATANTIFGDSTSINSNFIAVGASNSINDTGTRTGSVYLFDSHTGNQLFKLFPDDNSQSSFFGRSTDLYQNLLAVGAPKDDHNCIRSGAVYLFSTTDGSLLNKFVPADAEPNDFFGESVAIDNNLVVVGSVNDSDNGSQSGAVYIFDSVSGIQLHKLTPDDGAPGDHFGVSVDIDNSIIVVGSWHDGNQGSQSGSAYIFDANTGKQTAKLLPQTQSPEDHFGFSVAVSENIVAVGSPKDDDLGQESGSVYLYDSSNGKQISQILPIDGGNNDSFGESVAIHSNTIAVGAIGQSNLTGSAYLFDATTGFQTGKLLPNDGSSLDFFGSSIAIHQNQVVVGAVWEDGTAPNSGSAYVYNTTPPCLADLDANGTLNYFDISAFPIALAQSDPRADFTNDNLWDFFDVIAFLQALTEGCP